jgi:hypothetical protein
MASRGATAITTPHESALGGPDAARYISRRIIAKRLWKKFLGPRGRPGAAPQSPTLVCRQYMIAPMITISSEPAATARMLPVKKKTKNSTAVSAKQPR